jgi:large subunit ribosomal protein L31e
MAETKTDKIEREYTIPLRHRWSIVPRYKRTNKAVKAVKEFLVRHMKIRDRDLNKIKLDRYLNEALWHRGIKNPPARIKVLAVKEGEIVRVSAVELPKNIKFKKLREERTESNAKKAAEKKKEEKKAEEAEKPATEEVKKEIGEKKEEEKEDKAAVVEAGKELQELEAKKAKHTTKIKSPKQEKNQRTGYNQSSRGH